MEMNYDAEKLHRIEQELHAEILPGTEIMTDVGDVRFVKGGSHVLVPQPSDDPHDPLNWSRKWKIMCIVSATTVSFTQGLGPLALAPMFPLYMKDFDSSLPEVIKFTGVAVLVLGFSNFIWVPLSTAFGRRPVYIFSQLLCFVSSIWRALATDYASFMGACVLNGIAAGPGESIQPAVISDIFFLHDRGFWMTMYWTFYLSSLMIGPILSGSVSLHVGWRNFWWLNTAMIGVSLLMIIFMFPETKWHRPHPNELGKIDATSDASTKEDPFLDQGHPGKKQWGIYTPSQNPFKSIGIELWTPWKLFAFPIVEFAAFVSSWSASVLLTLNLTQSHHFAAPPYNFSPQTIGFTNFAILIGAMIGLVTAGPLSDWVSDRATRKNNGIREPEMRLPTMIPYILIMILGNFIAAFGMQHKWHWAVIVILGYTCVGIQVTALPSIVTTYSVDSYKPVAASVMVAVTVNKNVWGYGFSEFLVPWLERQGYVPPIMTNMCLLVLWCAFGGVFYRYGKVCRRWSRGSKVHLM
ncbi:MFS general substrate transporter [Piedraia hortae CBS 480.64]|uniref:MFS general substrate transporter n=1 Tax=Piedraia hortae CBS 480.64 TaxID=1314780 RepID=A0A6A7C4S3_9PEZI|nr:MFS general substrate transporter [Piedraia hortae CBS 480.64]